MNPPLSDFAAAAAPRHSVVATFGWDPSRISSAALAFLLFYYSFRRQVEQKGKVADEIMKGSFPQRIRKNRTHHINVVMTYFLSAGRGRTSISISLP